MILSLIQVFALSLASYTLWLILRPIIVKSPLSMVPGPPSNSWWKGSFSQVFNRITGWDFHHQLTEKYGGAVRLSMLFGDEQLYVSDPLALHHIVVKDQYIYEETAMFLTSNMLYFGKSLLSTLGEQHKRQRKILNPVFSLKHMKSLLPIFYPISHQLRDILEKEVRVREGQENQNREIDVMKWVSRAALECIGQGGLGYSFDALNERESNVYSETMKKLSPINARLFLQRQLLPYIVKIGTPTFRRRLLEWQPFESIKTAMGVSDLMYHCANDVLREKTQVGEGEGEVGEERREGDDGDDIMSVLLKANAEASEEDRMHESELLGHMGTLIFAGHDTTTTALCRVIHQLVLHPDAQERLRVEVTEMRRVHGDADYDTLMGLPYLDAVCRETLRLFPPVPQLNRTTRKDVVLPLLWPIMSTDGKTEIKAIALKKNTNVIISIIGANTSKRIWGADAEEWKPERWLGPLPESATRVRLPGVYSSTMTFLGGGRACIGFKFAEMEIKTILSVLLEKFVFKPGPDIFWAMNFLQSPVVKESASMDHQQLPLKVTCVEGMQA